MILVVGAGPTGLVLAYWLARLGVAVRIIDKAAEPGTTSRALAVQARTLELYAQAGLADGVVEHAQTFDAVNIWIGGRLIGHAEFGPIGLGLTPYPHILIFPQDQHERFLIDRLHQVGVSVERNVELTGFDDRGERFVAQVRHADGRAESITPEYLAGCDGARSRVREVLGTGFPGGTYSRIFYVADAQVHGAVTNHQLHVALDDADFLAVFPLKEDGVVRLIGTVQESALARGGTLTWNDVSRRALDRLQVTVNQVNWFSTYHVHHRVASSFRQGRTFLVGDAAHIHSPVGGQGMNTGIGDAVNLAWKLAAVVQERADPALLDSYAPERMAFAERLVATTDRAFTFSTANGPIARMVRRRIMPVLLPWLLNRRRIRRLMFRTISQTLVSYRDSTLSEGATGPLHGGDRLPWIAPASRGAPDNFTPLVSLDWQVHVYGTPSAELIRVCAERRLALHAFEWRGVMGRPGLQRDAAYLVRPDGYIAIANATMAGLGRYLDARGIRTRTT